MSRMTNKHFILPASLFFVLMQAVAVLSWIGSIYGWPGVQSLLNAEGLRWTLRNVMPNMLGAPWLGDILILAFGIGLCLHSGWWAAVRNLVGGKRKCSKKGARAWKISLLVGVAWLVVCAVAMWGPWGDLRSITGDLEGSPLSDGASLLCSSGLGLMGVAYGFAADHYRTDRDVVAGMSYAFRQFSACFVTLFFVAQFFAAFHYSGLYHCVKLSDGMFELLYRAFVVVSILAEIGLKQAAR